MAGTPPTGTAKKLGIRADATILFVDAPKGWEIPDLPEGDEVRRVRDASEIAPEWEWSVVVAFFRNLDSYRDNLSVLALALFPDRALWVAWPRRAGGHESDLGDNAIRNAALQLGLVDAKVAAIDGDWSGLRFVWRKELRARSAADR